MPDQVETAPLYPATLYPVVGLGGSGKTSAMRELLEDIISTHTKNPEEAGKILYTCITSHTGRGYREDDDPEMIVDPRTGLPYRLFLPNYEIYKRAEKINREREKGKTNAFPILFHLDAFGDSTGNPYFRDSRDIDLPLSLGLDLFYPTRSIDGLAQLVRNQKYNHVINLVADDDVRSQRKNDQRREDEDPERTHAEIYSAGIFAELANSVIVTSPPPGIPNPWQYSRKEIAHRLEQLATFGRRIPPEERKFNMHHHYVTETLLALGIKDGYNNVNTHVGESIKLVSNVPGLETIEAKILEAHIDDKTVEIKLEPQLERRRGSVSQTVFEMLRQQIVRDHMKNYGFAHIDPLHTYINTKTAPGKKQHQNDANSVTDVRYGLTDLTNLHNQYKGPQHTRITFT